MKRHLQPCSCILVTDDKKTFINGVDMTSMIANVCDIEWCPTHKAEWDESMSRWVDKMLDEAVDEILGPVAKRNNAPGS